MHPRHMKTRESLVSANLRRVKYIAVIIFLIEALFLFYVERMRLLDASNAEMFELIRVGYLLHLTLAVLAISTALFIHFRGKYVAFNTFLERLPLLFVFLVLMLSSSISVFDQLTHGHITIFTAHLLAFGLLIYIKPPHHFWIYGFPFTIFILGVVLFQMDVSIFLTHIINGSIIFLGILFVSRYLYIQAVYNLHYRNSLRHVNKKLEKLATHDALTHLPNRRFFETQVRHEIAINRRYNHEAALVLFDIDLFKAVNDTYGHHVGDEILIELGNMLRDNVRESDTVARWGGEEFMLLLSHTELEGARVLSERLRKKIADYTFVVDEISYHITVSIGITRLHHETSEGFKDSYVEADQALYLAKELGRNNVKMFNDVPKVSQEETETEES